MAKTGLVLSPGRDPYSVWTPMQHSRADFVARLFGRMNRRSHLRGFHYFLVSQSPRPTWPDSGEVYSNTESHWERLCAAAVWARYLGVGDWSNLVDRKHPEPIDQSDYDPYDDSPRFDPVTFTPDGLKSALLRGAPRYSTSGLSTYHLEVWVEKNSMNETIGPAIRKYGATLQPLVGESSLERVVGAIGRIRDAGKPARIFYISDFDPSGQQMPVSVARKLEFYARDLSLDVRLNPLALTNRQVIDLRLPGIPTKTSDSRAAAFKEQYGDRATELDALEALHPGALRRIVSEALAPYVDEDKVKAVEEINADLRRQFSDIVDEYQGNLEDTASDLNGLAEKQHESATGLTDDVEYPQADHVADETDDWLLDTLRDEADQHDNYMAYKGR